MRTSRKALLAGGIIAVLALAILFVIPTFKTAIDGGGGNKAAGYVCLEFARVFRFFCEQWGSPSATIAQMASGLRRWEMRRLTETRHIDAVFLVLDPSRPIDAVGRVPVIVRPIAYDNVPGPSIWNLWRRTPAHAVGYSDGTASLISPEEFAASDWSAFVAAPEWVESLPE